MPKRVVQRTQTGVRMETSLLKVLKGLAEYTNLSLGDLLEGIVLHSFEGKPPFSADTREVIELLYLEQLKPKEVADVLQISQPTVWTRHLRAIRRLTRVLEE